MVRSKIPITKQNDRADCGVACLQSLLHYYGGEATLEELRSKSGTYTQGTTLLGLYHAAQAVGFEAQGCEADAKALIQHSDPVILHVVLPEGFQHYVICYQAEPNRFTIADPATGSIEIWDESKLNECWKSKTCLTLTPKNITQTKILNSAKKEFLRDLLFPDLPLLAIAAGLGLIISLLGLVMAIFSQQLIDSILPNGQTQKFVLGLGLVFMLLLLRIGFQRLRQILLVRQTQAFNNRVIAAFYSSLLRLPITFFDTRKIGDLTARLNDTARIQRVIAHMAGNAIIEVLMVFSSLGFLFVYCWQVGLVALACAPVMFVLLYRYNKPIYTTQQSAMDGYAQSESYFVNSMQGALAIKQFGREATFAETNKSIYGQYQARLFDLGLINVRMGFQAGLLSLVFTVGVVGVAGALVLNKSLFLGEMMAAIGVATSLLPGVTNLALLSLPINEARVAYSRMFEILKLEPEMMVGKEIKSVESISLTELGFGYAGRSALFTGLNQTFTKGDVVLITGANGNGKTTFTKLL
jgi:ATP-binding cassette subfamily B protein